MPTDRERVAAGIEWLDASRFGWRENVDFDKLDLASAVDCLLGQAYAMPYWEAVKYSLLSAVEIVDLGFANATGDPGRYRELTAEWKRQLARSSSITLPVLTFTRTQLEEMLSALDREATAPTFWSFTRNIDGVLITFTEG